jgi:cell division septation protein DedD
MSTSSQREAQASDPTHVAQSTNLKRRRFLLALGAGGAGAAAVAAQPLAQPLAQSTAEVAADTPNGYRETEHIRDYYATTRI